MAAKFSPAPDVAALARGIIADHHPHLLVHKVRIEYLFRDVPAKKGGMTVWGDARKISSLAAFLAGEPGDDDEVHGEPFFVITIWEGLWRDLGEIKRRALLDHELAHCGADYDDKGKTKLSVIPHDLEEFHAIYARHGAWRQAIEDFLAAGAEAERLRGQMSMDDIMNGEQPSGAPGLPGGPRLMIEAAAAGGLPGGPKLRAIPSYQSFVDELAAEEAEAEEGGDPDVIEAEVVPEPEESPVAAVPAGLTMVEGGSGDEDRRPAARQPRGGRAA